MITRFTAAGARHVREGMENQDAAAADENKRYAACVLADGVSTCTQAQRGSQLACETVLHLLLGCGEFFMNATHDEIVRVVLRNVLHALQKEADAAGEDVNAYSSTLSFALHDRAACTSLLFQLGDGLILGAQDESCIPLIQPGSSRGGTCVTTTRHAAIQCVTRFVPDTAADAILLLTDGGWRSLLSGGAIRQDAARAFIQGDYDTLQSILVQTQPQDDHTLLIMTHQ